MVKMLIRNFKHYFYKFILSHFDKNIKNLNRYKTYEDGVPVETAISLSFKEMDLITAEKAAEGF